MDSHRFDYFIHLRDLKRELQAELHRRRATRCFERARRTHPALAGHATAWSVIGLLSEQSPAPRPEKEALLQALLAEHQRLPDALWAGLLLATCLPMLLALRNALVAPELPDADVGQIVVESFLAAIRRVPVGPRRRLTAWRLQRATEARVYAALRRERREAEAFPPADDEEVDAAAFGAWQARRSTRTNPERRAADRELVRLLLDEYGRRPGGPEKLAVLVATLVEDERLRDYVRRTAPGAAPAQQERVYQRLKRARSRTVERLRAMANGLRCHTSRP